MRFRLRWYAVSTARVLLRRWQALVLLCGILASAPFMSGRELLAFVAFAKRCALTADVMDICARFGLGSHPDTRCGDMSLGTQKKLMLATAWIGEPCVMLFDEPSNGLDAAARLVLIELLRVRSGNNVILVSTLDHEFAHAIGATVIEFDTLNG
ncbi:ATP-binding cassette domain-containing protein [Massilia scottii]|uniref:ATP-binding cassette domain-containing protein n=1 Tax=Massilia scottii TaxID=3057166 RepID=UPI002796DCA3|nr:ATP-binding cassette domain-containing protein [Massilia sp. CCM 9029]MDQ1833872.1 ATP-binding cassette domain-containing protein [Massilia sp. CCM 9029]